VRLGLTTAWSNESGCRPLWADSGGRRLTLTSDRQAMIDDGLRFALVPWTPARERRRDREVSGVAKENGGIEWNFARKRELEI
jgi:hypothetical protein